MKDSVLAPHRKHYIREMRVMGYSQLLQSYRSVTLESMAKSFGVSVDFIDRCVRQHSGPAVAAPFALRSTPPLPPSPGACDVAHSVR